MTPPTAILADDEPHLLRALRDALTTAWPELSILASGQNGVEAARLIDQHQPTVAFLDIQMPGLTGLDVTRGIEGETLVVFVTAYDEFAVRAFEEGAVDYLLKPINIERLQKCTERVKARIVSRESVDPNALAATLKKLLTPNSVPTAQFLKYLRAHERTSAGERIVQIDVNDVLYFDAADKYTCVILPTGEQLLRTSISELETQLDPAQFQRIHRSTMVNLRFVEATTRDDSGRMFVKIKNHAKALPVSRAYHEAFARM
jgi:DNA-binding LytR/AlgR family response regulator